MFVDYLNGDFRLQSNSPCINAGGNTFVTSATDLDGQPRIRGERVDVGAYEFQNPRSTISYAWLQQYRLPTDGTADFTDLDGDGASNWREWRCGSDPTDPLSVLRLFAPSPTGSNVSLSWLSVTGMIYTVERSTNRLIFTPLAKDVVGQAGTTTFTDTTAPAVRGLYRVGVSPP